MTIKKHNKELKAISDIASAANGWFELNARDHNHKNEQTEVKSSIVSNQYR